MRTDIDTSDAMRRYRYPGHATPDIVELMQRRAEARRLERRLTVSMLVMLLAIIGAIAFVLLGAA